MDDWRWFKWDRENGYGQWWKIIEPLAETVDTVADYTIPFSCNCSICVLRDNNGVYLSTWKIEEYISDGYMCVKRID